MSKRLLDYKVSFETVTISSITPIFITLPVLSSCYYLLRRHIFRANRARRDGLLPEAPQLFPFITYTFSFARGGEALRDSLAKHAITNHPVRLTGIGFSFALLSGKDLICKALTTSAAQHLDWNKMSVPYFGHIFGAPKPVTRAILMDDSGVGAKPYPGTSVEPAHRLLRARLLFYQDAFAKKSMDELVLHFAKKLRKSCESLNLSEEWAEMPSLHSLIKEVVFPAAVEAFFGSNLLADSPELLTTFWDFDDGTPFLGRMLPSFLRPSAVRNRDACLEAMKNWRRKAEEKSVQMNIDLDAVQWDPLWGIGAVRRRQKIYEKAENLFDEQAKASMDLEALWALASNIVPATTWFIFHVLANSHVLQSVRAEISASRHELNDSSFDADLLVSQPLLQSIWAETLRLHVFSLITRNAKSPISLGEWTIPKDQQILVSTQIEHHHPEWDEGNYSATTFWPERFLADEKPNQSAKFTLDGKHGRWMPFGLGEHMCPGRHLAKKEMFMTIATLLEMFDFELLWPEGDIPKDSLHKYGYGATRPHENIKFRLRKCKS